MGWLTNIQTYWKETGQKVSYFAGFFYHRLTTMNTHLQVYCYSLFESGMKTGL